MDPVRLREKGEWILISGPVSVLRLISVLRIRPPSPSRGEGVVPRPNLENLRQAKMAKLVGRMSKTSAKGADQKEYGRACLRILMVEPAYASLSVEPP